MIPLHYMRFGMTLLRKRCRLRPPSSHWQNDGCGARAHALADWRLRPAPETTRPNHLGGESRSAVLATLCIPTTALRSHIVKRPRTDLSRDR